MRKLLILLLLISLNISAAEKQTSDDIDHMGLAALLLKDGFSNRANDELNQVDTEDEALDKGRYFTLKGLVLTKLGEYEKANAFFEKALAFEETDKALYLYVAQNSYKLKDYRGALVAIGNAGSIADEKASVIALKAECLWQLKSSDAALEVLAEGIKRFPAEWNFYKQRFNYLVSLRLYQSALEDAQVYLVNAKPTDKTVISLISALRNSGDTDKAIELAEQANLRFITSADITVILAHLYIDKDMLQAAAGLFDEASIEDDKYTKEAAEMMRRAHQFTLALYKNSQMLEAKEKLKQRVAIFIEFSAYERILASTQALYRSELIEDESIRYALAYSYYMVGKYEECEAELKFLTRPDLFNKATELRKNMQKCKDNHWECTL
jgi:tetratricopeptide (TPR) repeat protein